MRALLTATLLIAVAGCSSERKQGEAVATPPAAGAVATLRSPPASIAALPARDDMQAAFASLPDRGELLAADPARRVQKHGAYTFEPVRISEAHALAAVGGRALVVDTPDGRQLRLAYADHVDHGDGNWTWIGRDAQGRRALITFGERAVFGSIPDDRGTLRVTTDRNGGWLVQGGPGEGSARARLAAQTGRSDFLVPPAIAMRDMPRTMGKASAGITTAAATATAGSVVDVAVGYTPGMLNELGNASAVITRINNVVAYANDAYANTGIAHRVRLVRTVQVNHDDASLNDTALGQLTGDDGSGNPVPVPAELQPLRSAGVDSGADIIVLMRNFMRVQESCGIAWLLGGDGSPIAGSVDYAYAVVSDGYEDDGGTRYLCEESTLAHEMGHVMGQTHDTANASGTGAHPYSFGYREASASGFYTIMAYGLDTQFAIPYFSTPAKTYGGRPMGVANESDNARSMTATMPIVAAFRASRSTARNDYDGDGRSDILWRNVSTGANQAWSAANNVTKIAVASVGGNSWQIVGTGDFDGDGRSDILWRNATTGQNTVWRSANNTTQIAMTTVGDLNWKVVGVGDFDGDGKSDVLWRHATNGQNKIWRSANNATQQAIASVADKDWRVAGTGDFNADGRADILWRNVRTGANSLWRSGNNTTQTAVASVGNLAWTIAGVGDFDGNGRADILWRNTANGTNQVWRDGNNATQQAVTSVGNQAWQVAAIADYDGDGRADVLWRNASSGANEIWRSCSTATKQAAASASIAWAVRG